MTFGYEQLLAPGSIGGLMLRNRILMCPMGDDLGNDDGSVSDRQLAYFEARAAGGAALLLVGSVGVSYPAGTFSASQTAASHDGHRAGLRRLADRVHAHGAAIAAQLVHAGPNALADIADGRALLVPSIPKGPRPDRLTMMVTPAEMARMTEPFTRPGSKVHYRVATDHDLALVIADFADAAARCVEEGFDAIELHGGHGYLLDAFRSGASNRRDDAWGGGLDGRARLLLETVRAVRARVGPDVPVWCRINAVEHFRPGGATLEETLTLAPLLVAAGCDALHVSAYASTDAGLGVTEAHTPSAPGHLVALAAAVKRVVEVPVITFGRLEPEAAERVLADGHADFVAMGRKLLADPDLPNKLAAGRRDDIRPCLYQYRCIGNIFVRDSIACVANAATARETELTVPPAAAPRRILVAGGGPAGLETARLLAASGHTVELWDAAPVLGGRLALGARADDVLDAFLGWLVRQVEQAGVGLRLATPVTIDAARGFDAVVVATGARWDRPKGLPGAERAQVRTLDELEPWLAGRAGLEGHVVFLGGGKIALTLALHARARGNQVTVIDPTGVFAPELGLPGRFRLVHDVETAGAKLLTGTWTAITAEGVAVVVADEPDTVPADTVPADTVIIAHGPIAEAPLAVALRAAGVEVHVVGDCREVNRIEGAMLDATRTAVVLAV